MTGKRSTVILSTVAFIFALVFTGQSVQADWGVSYYGEVRGPRYDSYGDRIASEYRQGYKVDDWLERGTSSITDSPVFTDGVRLAAWASQYEEDHDFALASAIYFFEIPYGTRSIKVKIYYEGESDAGGINDGIAGRVWVKRAYRGDDYTEYYPDEGRYEDADQPLYGDTFVLRSRKHLQILRMSADDHVVDGMMELHLVAEGRQRLDVKYIEVESYSYLPGIKVVTRYHRDYAWQPWYNYTYWYFYTGPTYHFADNYYVRYTYPSYRTSYITIRRQYNNYLRGYYYRHPRRHVRWTNVTRVRRGTRRTWDRNRLSRWTRDHDVARKKYVSTRGIRRRSDEIQKSRLSIKGVLSSNKRMSPATTKALAAKGLSSTAPKSSKGGRTTTGRPTSISEMKQRKANGTYTSPRSKTSTSTSRSSVRKQPQSRNQTPNRSKTPSRTSVRSQPTTRKKTPAIKSRTSTSKSSSPTKRTTSTSKSSSSPKKTTPAPSKSDDDDEEDEKKKKAAKRPVKKK